MALHSNKCSAVFVLLCIGFLVSACGSSGGGGSGVSDNVRYSGSTSPAVLNANNAESLSLEASMINGSDAVSSGSALYKPGGRGSNQGPDVAAAHAYKTLMRLIRPSLPGTRTANYAFSQNISGSCGGSYSFTLTIDEETFDIAGSMQYNSFCDSEVTHGATISGYASFTISSSTPGTMSMRFTNYYYNDGVTLCTMSGTINYSGTDTDVTMEIPELRYSEGSPGNVYKVENYSTTMTVDTDPTLIEITSGTFYDPYEGSVFVNTPVTIEIYNGDQYPSTGLIKVEGSNGGFANVTFINTASYHILVDNPPGGGFEVDETKFW
jgi:hypothetical protein